MKKVWEARLEAALADVNDGVNELNHAIGEGDLGRRDVALNRSMDLFLHVRREIEAALGVQS